MSVPADDMDEMAETGRIYMRRRMDQDRPREWNWGGLIWLVPLSVWAVFLWAIREVFQ